ncbi:MAG TPA: thioesterase family protein [Thermoanaerobaculia bacterium]|nr:thioesterase family protein [Thermoanaerobaculia bacterium]
MTAPFEKTLYARWGDMDFNGHMKNTAYLDASADVRMMFFAEHGFSMREFEQRRFGPVILRDELEYFRELRLLEPVRVTLLSAGMSEDGIRFKLVNEFFRGDGARAARVVSTGGWLNLDTRKWTPPPEELFALMSAIVRTEDYAVLPAR